MLFAGHVGQGIVSVLLLLTIAGRSMLVWCPMPANTLLLKDWRIAFRWWLNYCEISTHWKGGETEVDDHVV